MSTLLRRCVTVPLYLGLAACVPLFLFLLPFAALLDCLRRANWATVRALLFFAVYVICEAVGILAATLLWVFACVMPGLDDEAYLRANFRLQCWWAASLYSAAEIIFGMDTEISGGESFARGPFVVFARHASTADTLLPAIFISNRYDILLRYVLKRELLWDPCLDIVGHRLRNHFVDRGSEDRVREIENVASLADGLGEREGVLIFPEGTRFSKAKLARSIAKLDAAASPELAQRARAMRNVLPPKLGGPIALLRRNRNADLVLLGHTGFEGIESLTDLFNGSLIGRVICLRFWRISRLEIPTDETALSRWLFDWWGVIDQWIEDVQARPRPQPVVAGGSRACRS